MAGEVNGTNAVLHDSTGSIVGQVDATITFNGNPIDISNKSAGDYIKLMDGELAGRQVTIAMSIIFNSNATFAAMEAAAIAGTLGDYHFDYGVDPADKSIVFNGMPTAFSQTASQGGPLTASVTFLSSDSFSIGTVGP